MANWYVSGLRAGDELVVKDITETGRPANVVKFIQDIPCGILVELFFNEHSYKRCIGWSAIHNGTYSVRTAAGQLRAKRVVQKGEWDGDDFE